MFEIDGLATVEEIVKVYDGFLRAYNDDGACFESCLKDIERRTGEEGGGQESVGANAG